MKYWTVPVTFKIEYCCTSDYQEQLSRTVLKALDKLVDPDFRFTGIHSIKTSFQKSYVVEAGDIEEARCNAKDKARDELLKYNIPGVFLEEIKASIYDDDIYVTSSKPPKTYKVRMCEKRQDTHFINAEGSKEATKIVADLYEAGDQIDPLDSPRNVKVVEFEVEEDEQVFRRILNLAEA